MLDNILNTAKARANTLQLPYLGAVTPQEAHAIHFKYEAAIIVDVRSTAELDLVGRIPGVLHIEWAFYPGMVRNALFMAQLEQHTNKDDFIILMCRTGGRSHNAATVAHNHGFTHVMNMLEGFEGEANEYKQRTLINGWKHANLPWTN